MLNSIPVLGWFISFIASASLSVPFWICWTSYGIGSQYFNFLPTQWQSIPFWNCVMLFTIISILKAVLLPRFADVKLNGKDD